MQTEGRENCGGFSPFLWKNRARGAERGLRSGKGRSAAHSPLSAAKTSRITLSCILRSKIVHFWHFPACGCGRRRYATHPLPLAHFADYGGSGGLFAGFSLLSSRLARRRHIESVICSLSPIPPFIAPLCFPLLKFRPHMCIMSL